MLPFPEAIKQAAKAAKKAISQHQAAASIDAEFDGGEFSIPAHWRELDTELNAIAAKYQITRESLDSCLMVDGMDD